MAEKSKLINNLPADEILPIEDMPEDMPEDELEIDSSRKISLRLAQAIINNTK